MRKNTLILICALLIIGLTISGNATTEASNDNPLISGSIVSGYRVLPIQESEEEIHFTVYRGDYIKFEFDKSISLPSSLFLTYLLRKRSRGTLKKPPILR